MMLPSEGFNDSESSFTSNAKDTYEFWAYNPATAPAIISAGTCSLLTVIHCFRLVKSRAGFCIPIVIGGLLETIGYIARAVAHNKTTTLPPYVAQSLLLLLAPIFFAASIYSILGRLIHNMKGDDISIVHPSIMTRFFVSIDVLCFLIQGAGGGMLTQAKSQDNVKFGNGIILFGLALQIYIFCFFVRIAGTFHRDIARYGGNQKTLPKTSWRRYFISLYVACACMGIRNVYRIVEYATGEKGYLKSHEWPLYAMDLAPMAITLIVSLVWYDRSISQGDVRGENLL
ncbi:RTA1-domain-containing protein [Pyrenochaeta sp. DS3sAY3a]|nr:RTA1-domain-containing protein [Pyrenochaeta sp. DS3sAY3a]